MGGHLKRLLFSSWSVNKHGHYRQFLFLVGRFLKTFSETAWSNKTNFTRIIYGSSFIRFPPFSRWDKQTCLPWGVLVSDWLKLKKIVSSKTRSHNELLLCRNDVWEILYKISIFWADHTTSGRQFLFVISQLKKSSLKPFGQINWNLVGSVYGRFCSKFPQNEMTVDCHRLTPLSL